MYVILVYDFGEKRVNKMLKLCRKYLNWIQNSVFEGEIPDDSLSIQISAHLSLIVTSKSKEAPLSQMTKYKFSWIAYSDKLGYLEPPPERADKRPVAVLALGQSAERKLPPLPVTKDKAQTTYEVQEMVQIILHFQKSLEDLKSSIMKMMFSIDV